MQQNPRSIRLPKVILGCAIFAVLIVGGAAFLIAKTENEEARERFIASLAEQERQARFEKELNEAVELDRRTQDIIKQCASEVDFCEKMAKLADTRTEQNMYLAKAAKNREAATRAHYALKIAAAKSPGDRALLEAERDKDIAAEYSPSVYLRK